MKKLIEFFDRAYVINLAERSDRRKEVVSQLSQIGIEVPNKNFKFFTSVRPTDKGIFHSTGVRGCYESHKAILRGAAEQNLSNVLIMEDDVWFRKIDPALLDSLLTQIKAIKWDLLFLGRAAPPDDGLDFPLTVCTEDIRGTHFYAVNGTFLPELLTFMDACEARPRDHPDGGPMPIDGIYNHIRYGNKAISLAIAVPNLAVQRSSRSDITTARYIDQFDWLRGLVGVGRRLKHHIRRVFSPD